MTRRNECTAVGIVGVLVIEMRIVCEFWHETAAVNSIQSNNVDGLSNRNTWKHVKHKHKNKDKHNPFVFRMRVYIPQKFKFQLISCKRN